MKTNSLYVVCFLLLCSISFAAESTVVHIFLDGPIHAVTSEYVTRGIDHAQETNAELVILQVETPGGIDGPMRTIISKMVNSKVPVAVYVAPGGARATSAGFFITIAADLAVMAPGTHLGSAHPVTIGEGGEETENRKTMMKKATEDSVAYIKTLAEKRSRNIEQAEKAVRDSISFTETEALKWKLIDFIAKDKNELLQKANGLTIKRFDGSEKKLNLNKPRVIAYEMTRRQRFLSFLADPNITVLLFSIGMIGILMELYHPGAILPGIVGVISLSLCILSAQILPINYIGAMLIAFSIVLFLLEIKITSYGLLTIGGVVSFVLGATMLFDAPIPEMRISYKVIGTSVFLITATMAFLLFMVVSLHRRKPVTGLQGLLQETGIAQTDIHGSGKVFVHGELWNATANEPISKGEKVKIVSVEGLNLRVEKQ
ncbi:nodulation protein NfeD [bacterium]|nr:nodulation protein NfeD [bacterium]MCI0605037.1 nodulation protein NfeD [bacterium]